MSASQIWEVVGGAKGGILVREGRELNSPEASARLACGSLIEEKELKGERLNYRLLEGEGPEEGWVSLKLKEKDLVAKTDKQPRLDVAPSWLRPTGGMKILFLTIPWKGHIVHQKRIAEWFEAQGGYDLHAAIFPESEGVFPKSCKTTCLEGDELVVPRYYEDMEDGFRRLGLQEGDYKSGISGIKKISLQVMAKYTAINEDPMAALFRFYFRVILAQDPKPDLIVGDTFCDTWNMMRAHCHSEGIKFVVVNSPGISEQWVEEGETIMEMDTTDDEIAELTAKAVNMPVELVKLKDPNAIDPEKLKGLMQSVPKPADMVLVALIQNLGNPSVAPFMTTPIAKKLGMKPALCGKMIRAMQAAPVPVGLYPSSPALLGQRNVQAPDLYTGPFLPMPEPLPNGEMQRDRAGFEATLELIEPDLLDWLYNGEASTPVVYMAFGSIVKPNADMLKRLVEALDGGPWRVLWALKKDLHESLPAGLQSKEQWRIMDFVPQADVLKCNRVKCFISHNGANSTVESLACGVPMVCMPFYMDQYDWARVVCKAGKAGVQVDRFGSASELREAVTKVLGEPSYHEAALAMSGIMRQQEKSVLRRLGKAMEPPSKKVGYGVSLAATVIMAAVKGKDDRFIWELINKSSAEAIDGGES